MQKIAIIDYGMGNLHSVASALSHVAPEAEVTITSDNSVIEHADRVVFPGVGAIRDCVGEIRKHGFDQTVANVIASGKPTLGICVGMQALMASSEENGGVECLAHFDSQVRFFSADSAFLAANETLNARMKVPHMGWNQVEQTIAHPLWQGIENRSRFYFVHSYFVDMQDKQFEAGRCTYGVDFTAAVFRDNLFAVQFHPEKSHTSGLTLLKNFVSWNGQL